MYTRVKTLVEYYWHVGKETRPELKMTKRKRNDRQRSKDWCERL